MPEVAFSPILWSADDAVEVVQVLLRAIATTLQADDLRARFAAVCTVPTRAVARTKELLHTGGGLPTNRWRWWWDLYGDDPAAEEVGRCLDEGPRCVFQPGAVARHAPQQSERHRHVTRDMNPVHNDPIRVSTGPVLHVVECHMAHALVVIIAWCAADTIPREPRLPRLHRPGIAVVPRARERSRQALRAILR